MVDSHTRRLIVLCVDDNEEVLQSLRRELRRGLRGRARIELSNSAAMALKRLGDMSADERVGVVIVSDWLMPGMRGDEFVHQVQRQHGALPVVVLSGHISGEAATAMQALDQVRAIMPKPWRSEDLLSHIEQALALESSEESER